MQRFSIVNCFSSANCFEVVVVIVSRFAFFVVDFTLFFAPLFFSIYVFLTSAMATNHSICTVLAHTYTGFIFVSVPSHSVNFLYTGVLAYSLNTSSLNIRPASTLSDARKCVYFSCNLRLALPTVSILGKLNSF